MREDLEALHKPYIFYFLKVFVPLAILLVSLLIVNGFGIITGVSYLIFYVIIYVFGTNIFFHRYWSHKHFSPNIWILKFFTVAGLFSLVGGPVFYALAHRQHHKYSDGDLDPHSPCHGRWHAFAGWVFNAHKLQIPIRLIRDLLVPENAWLISIDRYKVYIIWAVIIVVGIINQFILTGLLLAMFTAYFIELFINAWMHNTETKTAKNAPAFFCWLTAGGLKHRLHHEKPGKTTNDDPAYFLVGLLNRKK